MNIAKACAGAVITSAIGLASTAEADIDYTSIYVQANYAQSASGITPLDAGPVSFPQAGGNVQIQLTAGITAASDFTAITITLPGGTTQSVPYQPEPAGNGTFQVTLTATGYNTLADLNAAYPLGTYTFNAVNSNTLTSQSATLDYAANHPPSAVAALTSASYLGLNGMNASAGYTLGFNSFNGDGSTRVELAVFDVATQTQLFDTFYSADTTSILLAANTLLPGTEYLYALGFDNGVSISGGSIEQEDFTFGEFTTGGSNAVPEPTTLALMGLALAGLGLARRKRKD